jgi:hypothetical protein
MLNNLQITVKDVHIRMEVSQPSLENYSLGVTLGELNVTTIDEAGDAVSIESDTEFQNQDLPVYKKLELNSFSVYWNDSRDKFISETPTTHQKPDRITLLMHSTIWSPQKLDLPKTFKFL